MVFVTAGMGGGTGTGAGVAGVAGRGDRDHVQAGLAGRKQAVG